MIPESESFAISYGNELVFKARQRLPVDRRVRWYRRTFPNMHIVRSLEDEVETSLKEAIRKATSVGGALTGMGGNMIIIDDPQKPIDAQSKVRRRQPQSVVHQHAHVAPRQQGKLARSSWSPSACTWTTSPAHLMKRLRRLGGLEPAGDSRSRRGDPDRRQRVPSSTQRARHFTPRMNHWRRCSRLQRDLGTYDFGAQYQQCPIPDGGAMIQSDWFRFYEDAS